MTLGASKRNPLLRNRKEVDMTQGNIARHILSFAFPLLLGNIFQQLYNTVDTWVVGNFASDTAYPAVGTVGPIINTLIGFFMGLSAGAGVVISQYYGAKMYDKVKETVHTAITMTLILGVVMTVLGLVMIPMMLGFIKMPETVLPSATIYLSIYFSGLLGLMLYNIGAGILRAVGDSTRPFLYLVFCAIMNTVLDLLFVCLFKMDVAGVALATILSQGCSAVLVIRALLKTDSCIRLFPKELRIHLDILKKIFSVGIPSGLQMAVTAFSNIFVQSYINYFQDDVMSGWTTFAKVDQLLFLPMQSIGLAATTFVGQNLGCNQTERARKGVTQALVLSLSVTILLSIPIVIFASPIVYFFNQKEEVIKYGTLLLQWISPFYALCCFNQIYACALRGAGNSRAPMITMLSSYVLFRQLYLFVMSQVCNQVLPIAMAYPAGWLLCSILTTVYYHRTKLTNTRLVEDKTNA